MSNKTGEIDPIQKELAGRVREVGNHAIWSLSSCKPGFGVDQLRDDITETYWQSDGQLPHLVNIQFKRKTTICDICIYTDYKLDESYTPSRISIRAGTNFNDLQEIEVMDLNEPSGWVIIPIKDINDRPIRTFMIQIAVISNHQNGRDTHMRQINVYSPTQDIFGPPASYIAASKDFNNNTLSKINKKIMEYIKNAAKISFRYKRELYENSERDNINILNGFQDINKLNFEDVQDINFFSFQYEFETMWFVVILDTSKLSLYQINNGSFYNISDYFVRNGTQIIVNSCTYGALFIIQNQNGPVLILSFTKILDKYYLQQIQDFELNNTTHLSIWNGINQLHLAIVSHSNISIYTWFNNYFDLIQIINISTKKIIPFQSKGFMYLAVTGSTTLIFKYFLKSNKFLIIQRLPPSQDVSYFQLNKQHFMEYFLILSMKSSIIIYKELHNRFVPFQQISFSKIIVPIISSKAIVVLTLHKNTIIAYQYDGWKFIKINTKLSGIIQYNLIILYEKELLLIKNKNNKWTLKQLLWIKKKSYKDLREEIKIWNINVKNKLQKITEEIPNFKLNFKILKSHIDQLQVHNINDYNLQTLKNVSKQYNRLINKFQAQKIIINNKWQSKNLIATSLHAKKIQIKCKTNCKFNRLYVKENHNFLFKLIVSKNKNQLSDFKELNIKEIKNWKCPLLSLAIKDIIIHKMINGISLNYLQKNALKIINDQEVFGKHIFINMKAINVSMPLNIATYFTNQEIRLKEIKVKQLNLTTGGILLPLNSLSTTVINFIKTPQLKIKNNISLKGKQTGKGSMRLGPVIDITKSMNLYNNFNLENVKIENLKSIDLITKTGSIKNILSNAITLYENVPISLILSSEKMKWSNITLHKPKKWITVNFQNIIISGKKHIYHNVQITKFSYDNLKFSLNKDLFLKDSKLCATFIFAPKIRTLFLTGNNITVQKLISSHVFGNIGLYSINNSTVSFNSVLSEKKYCHNIIAKNIFALQLNNLNLTDLKRLINIWIEPSFLNTSINTINLITNILRSPFQFYIKLPKIIKNIIFEQNVLVNNINGINFSNFLLNTIKFNDMVSLQNITFRNGISTNDIYVSHLPFNLTNTKKDLNLYKKRISGSIKVNAINLPYVFKILENKTLVDISIVGSVKFCYEPTIKNINDIKLKKLSSEIWMVTNTITIFHGKNMHFHDIMIKKYVALNNLTNTLSFKMWNNSLKSILSKTKLQEIEFPASFNDIKISNIISSNISIIQSSLSDFNNIFENSLLKNKDQEVKTKWIFNKLKISDTGNLYIKQTINNLYFKSDVMKHNSKENIVTGKKKVLTLIVENLNGYNFNKWTTNALMRIKKDIIIKGRKKFSIVTFNNIKMSKTIMGYAIDKVLRKSTNQIIYSQKTIQGFISASEFIINGLINDVNLTKLVHHQLKKNNPLQTIRTGIELHNSLNIIGNLTIKGAYEKSEMKIFDKNYSNAQTIIKRIKKFIRTAEIINIALQNRAIYINKLEIINDTINAFNKSMIIQYNTVQCNSKKFSSYCISKYAKEFIFQTNISNFILLQSIMMDEKEFIILVKFNSISIYSFINIGNNFVHLKDLYFPNIMDAFVEQKWHGFGLWIILRLISQTLVLLYQPWGNIQQYILPVTDVFLINRSPNNQLLLLLSNGIWDLEGLASPRNIIEIPLKGRIETVADKFNYYVKCISRNETALMKARYI